MRVAFMGTPDVAASILEALLDSEHSVEVVVTQPDKPRGRGREVSASPVKAIADARGIPALQPRTPKEEGFVDALAVFAPQALAVVAYGHILPVPVLELAPAMNVHFSLLPRYRGAAPVQRALMDGATETGVSVFMLEPTIDTGPVVAVESIAVGPEETTGDVLSRLAPIGARLLTGSLSDLEAGTIQPVPQDDTEASPAPKITPAEAEMRWSSPAKALADLVRALNPRPGAFTTFKGKRLIVWRARPVDGSGEPGAIVEAGERLVVSAGAGALAIEELQLEGKRPMAAAEFVRGYRPAVGAFLAGS